MNTPQTWSESPIHEQIRDAGLDPVNRTTNDTPTPETDEHEFPCMTWPSRAHPMVVRSDLARKLERELAAVTEQRDEWKAKYIQQNKDLGHELRDPNGTIWSECKRLQTELTAVTKQRDEALEKVATMVLAGDYNDLFIAKVTGNLAARAEITAVTEQRDSLIKAVERYTTMKFKKNTEPWVGDGQGHYPNPVCQDCKRPLASIEAKNCSCHKTEKIN